MEQNLTAIGEPRNILIVLLGALGDVARGSTLIPPLRRRFPEANISWLVETKSASFVRLNERVDTVYEFVRSRWWEGAGLLRELRQRRFDLVLDLQRHLKSGLFSFSTGAPRRVGVNRKNAKEGNWVFNTEQCKYIPDSESKMELYRAFLTALGIEEGLDHTGGFRREQFLPLLPDEVVRLPGRRVGVVMGSTWPTKDLPKQGYQQLIALILKETDLSVVLLGDKTQAALGKEIAEVSAGGPRIINVAGSTNLGQLMGVLASSAAVIGPDSGPGHLSSLVGTPYVTIFGPTDPKRVAPFGSETFSIIPAIGCAPCWRRSCPGLNNLCMRLHSPSDMVAQVIAAASTR
jgi:ADP-heptose:LPS heptosyltransferase